LIVEAQPENKKCILPVPDNRPDNMSKPSIAGKVVGVQADLIELKNSSVSEQRKKLVSDRTYRGVNPMAT
jgi:hypothetical protein